MIKIALDKVFLSQPAPVGSEFGKSLGANEARGIKLWYLGHGVLVEQAGKKDILVPIANVLLAEASERIAPEQWAADVVTPAASSASGTTRARVQKAK